MANTLSAKPVALTLSCEVYSSAGEAFMPHHGRGAFDSYLTMVIPYQPIQVLFEDLKHQLGYRLINRGEAHITIITPPEYDTVLKRYVPIEKIEKIAAKAGNHSVM